MAARDVLNMVATSTVAKHKTQRDTRRAGSVHTFRIGCAQIEHWVLFRASIVFNRHARCTCALHTHMHCSTVISWQT